MLFVASITAGLTLQAQAPFFKTIVYDKEKKGAKLQKIFQDKSGVMWLGTNMGLCRYDGVSFRYLDNNNNEVSCMGQSNDGIVWMGHSNGILGYVDQQEAKRFRSAHGLPKTRITDIVFDHQNRMWVSTYGEGIFCYANDTLYRFNLADGLSDVDVYDLLEDDAHHIWAATDLGISICSVEKGKKMLRVLNEQNGLPDNIVKSLKKDSQGNIWIALEDKGVCCFDKKSAAITVPEVLQNWRFGQVNDVLPMRKELFIATEDSGIVEVHPGLQGLNKMMPARNKKINAVQQLLLDADEQVWVIADNMLFLANSNRFQTIEIPLPWQDPVKAITTDQAGRLWFANSKGIFTKQNNNSPVEKLGRLTNIDYSSVVSMYADERNRIWIGTYNYGLFQFDPLTGVVKNYTVANGLVDNNIFSIAGRGNEIWLGTLGGATRIDLGYDRPLFENYNKQNGLNNNYVYNISIDAAGNKWFATDGSGLTKLANTGFEYFNRIPGLEKNIVYTSTQDNFGNTWFSGLNSGLFSFDGFRFKQYTIRNGMDDNEIINVVADDNGSLLLSHPDGLEVFDISREHFTFYGAESGFENIKPQINACCKAPDHSILIGSADKIIRYYPADSNFNQLPQLVMNDVQLFFKSIGNADGKTFHYNQNHFTFDYAGLWYINPDALNYQYELEGYGKGWINTKDHIITFPQLPPGHYTFKVKTSLNKDFRYSPELHYSFTILKPFWKTAWFTILVLSLAAISIYYLVRLRVRMLNFKQEKENQQLMAELSMLRNQLNPHFLFNSFNTLMNIIDKDKSMAMEYAEKLSDFYREILLMQDKEMVTVKEELHLLQNYIYLQQKRFGDNLQLQLNVNPDDFKAGIPPLTLQLLAENALKHNKVSAEQPLSIKIESAQSFLLVSNNINRQEPAAKSTGTGLNNIRQRVQLLTGQEVKLIVSETEFNIIIPLKKT